MDVDVVVVCVVGFVIDDYMVELKSFDDMVVFIGVFDFVIIVCMLVVYLVGVFGVCIWVLFDVNLYWLWLFDCVDSLWYLIVMLYW